MQLYMISFPHHLSEKVYLGISSRGAARRFADHCRSTRPYPIAQAIRKYGPENAILTVIAERSTWGEIYALEQAAIAACNSKAPAGYNLTDGGPGRFGLPTSAECKRKIGDANRGRKASDETRSKLSVARRARKHTPEAVAKMVAFHTGRKRSEDTCRRMSENRPKRKIVCVDSGQIFDSISLAAKWLTANGWDKATRTGIWFALNGKREISYGYRWAYV